MRTYGQFCPVARASEILAERWTPVIVRNLLLGCSTFGEILSGAPGIPRGLLSKRLRELERAGVISIRPKPEGRGSVYELTQAGRELWSVVQAMREWGLKWLEVAPAHANPDVVLWSWCTTYLERELPRPRRHGAGPGRLRPRHLPAPGRAQGALRPRQCVPAQPEHQAHREPRAFSVTSRLLRRIAQAKAQAEPGARATVRACRMT